MKTLFGLTVLLLCQGLCAQETNWAAINLAVTDAHVQPAYDGFATASRGLGASAAEFCVAPDQQKLTRLQQAFHQAMDGWQLVQHIQFGPITYFNWNYRLQYWPDEKGSGARQLDALLAAADESAVNADNFDHQSVGVQGFPALERLIFSEAALTQLQESVYRCQVVEAISLNLESIAADVRTRWQDEFRTTIANADERGYFESAEDATIDFYKALVETVRKYQEQKLAAVLGDSIGSVRVRRAESWRSERSLRNLKLNFQALSDLYSLGQPSLGSVLQVADQQLVSDAFDRVQQDLQQLPDGFAAQLARAGGEQQLRALLEEIDLLFETLEASLKNTDLYLGFNSLDGD